MPDRDDLRARLAAVRAGDEVRVTFKGYLSSGPITVYGKVWKGQRPSLWLGEYLLVCEDGSPGLLVLSLDSHTPATPPEPEQPAVYVEDPPITNVVWQPSGDRWWCGNRRISRDWPELVREFPGTVYVPREKGEDRNE